MFGLEGKGYAYIRDSHENSRRKRHRTSEKREAFIGQFKLKQTEKVQVMKTGVHPDIENGSGSGSGSVAISDFWVELNSQIHERSNAKTTGKESSTESTTWMDHSSPYISTNSYNLNKGPKRFLEGQIWAIYDDYGLPRRYVEIEVVSSYANYSCVTLLKQNSLYSGSKSAEPHIGEVSWFRPVCGFFTHSLKGLVISRYSFSHIVYHQFKERNGVWGYDVYPRKGELWCVYMDGKKNHCPRFQKYQLVEILNDFNGNGMKAACLTYFKDGTETRRLYKRQIENENEVCIEIKPCDLNILSHKVPFSKITGTRCFEVDPASVPLYLDSPRNALESRFSLEFIRMKFLDYKSLILKEKLRDGCVWALYDDVEGLPRKYGLIQSAAGRDFMTWLEPCPQSENERNWYEVGLPIACGNFRLGKSILGLDLLLLSHPGQYDLENRGREYRIYPRKGEVWGIYKNWNQNPESFNRNAIFEYEFVEILTNFSESKGIYAVHLDRVEDFSCLFRPSTAVEIRGSELSIFSYQIQKIEIGGGFLLLDPLVVSMYPRKSCSSSSPEDAKCMQREDEKMDVSKLFTGQIWALYEESDQMPRTYAVVCSTSPRAGKVEVTMLKPLPLCKEEMEWLKKDLPISCGTFRADKESTLKDVSQFSHEVMLHAADCKMLTPIFKIFPRKGEIWAVCQNWEPGDIRRRRYQMVEIISSFDEEFGTSVAPIFEVVGSRNIYSRHLIKGFELVKRIPAKEMLQFSHRIPALRISEDGSDMQKKGPRWILELAAVPNLSS